MEEREHSGIGLASVMGVLVGVVAMLIVIPVVSQLMNFDEPKPIVEEYVIKYNNNLAITLTHELESVNDAHLDDLTTYMQGTPASFLKKITFDHDYCYITITEAVFVRLADVTTYYQSAFTDCSVNGFGLYDFTAYTDANITNNLTLVPVYTPF
jgi:hypothetical protein